MSSQDVCSDSSAAAVRSGGSPGPVPSRRKLRSAGGAQGGSVEATATQGGQVRPHPAPALPRLNRDGVQHHERRRQLGWLSSINCRRRCRAVSESRARHSLPVRAPRRDMRMRIHVPSRVVSWWVRLISPPSLQRGVSIL